MDISAFILVILNINLVLTDDSMAIENNVGYKETEKAVTEPMGSSQIDQIAESSNSVGHTYNIREENQNQVQVDFGQNGNVYHDQNVEQQTPHTSHSSGQEVGVNNLEILQPALTQGYPHQGQPIYVQHPLQTIRIFGAEASPLYQNQLHENEGQTIGYSSYVEHVSQKDEEEIKSALKEGSVSDIKRLVPKSGISFKIYKNNNLENAKTDSVSGYSQLHHKIKTELPGKQQNTLQFQTVYSQQQQQQPQLENLQQTYNQPENSLQSDGSFSQNAQTNYFPQPNINSQKTLQSPGKTLSLFTPNFKINVEGNHYRKATSAPEYNSLYVKHGLTDISNYPKQWNYDTKSEGSQKAVKKIKPINQYEIDPVAVAERNKVHYNQDSTTNFNIQKTNYLTETPKSGANYQSSYTGRGNQNLSKKGYPDKKAVSVKNRQPGKPANYAESIIQEQNVGHLPHSELQTYKGSQSEHYPLTSYPESETVKTGQYNLISQVETKNSQTFDHQKALEGSTSFDIKNAIDSSGSLSNSFDDVNYQQLSYVISKIPTSGVVLDAGAHVSPIVENHQIKDFTYHPIPLPEVSGKFLHQTSWSSEQLKHGNDLHQPIIKLHLPKEEFYQHLKTPNVEVPTSSISHIAYQQKQPYVVHYDVPFVKYPQEIHLQHKTKTRIQNQGGNVKLGQPLAIDWSLFKSTFPNFNVAYKPEITTHVQDSGKKIVPILIRKRKNRSNNKQEIGMVVYGKANNKRRPVKPSHRQEKNVRMNLLTEASSNVKQYEPKGERKNEFSVSASYKVDRSFKTR